MLEVGVLGLGAIGHVIGAPFLEKSGVRIHFYNRSTRPVFRFQPFDRPFIQQNIACELKPPKEPIVLDWLFICLKTYHYQEAESWFKVLISRQTRVVVLRNGLNLAAPLLPFTTAEYILPVLVDAPTQYDRGKASYVQMRPAHLLLPPHPLSEELRALLHESEIAIAITSDFKTASWSKLLKSASLGAIMCLSGQTCRIFKRSEIRALYRSLLLEGIAVAKADGAQLSTDYVELMLEKLSTYPPEKGSSMLTDRQSGRPIEVMAKSGAIAQRGVELGIPTPLHTSFSALLEVVNREGE